jgi:hypothetical protein
MIRLEAITEIDQEVRYRYVNDFGHLILRRFPVLRHTKAGTWISADGAEKFVLNIGRKRYAYPTEKEALTNFIKRTERHVMLASGNLGRAREALDRAKAKAYSEAA